MKQQLEWDFPSFMRTMELSTKFWKKIHSQTRFLNIKNRAFNNEDGLKIFSWVHPKTYEKNFFPVGIHYVPEVTLKISFSGCGKMKSDGT